MKIYCSCCDKVQPVRIDNCRDAKTNEPFQDIVCAECDLVIASGTGIAPPSRKPLTEEHAKFVIAMHTTLVNAHYDEQRNTNIICEKTDSLGLVRAVEKAHGIGEKA